MDLASGCASATSIRSLHAQAAHARLAALITAVFLGAPLSSANTIAGGTDHTVALKSDGTVWTWGDNTTGELGLGTSGAGTGTGVPTQVPGLSNVVAVAAGQNFSVALDASGHVWTWGDDSAGQIGDGSVAGPRVSPYQVAGGLSTKNVVMIAAGQRFVLALTANGDEVWSWGLNSNGQLGDNTTTQRTSPVQVKATASTFLSGITRIAAGGFHSLAIRNDGKVLSWGKYTNGQLGIGTVSANQKLPVLVLGVGGTGNLTGIEEIAAGLNVSYALAAGGNAVYSFGHNSTGQLGINNAGVTQSTTPLQVVGVGGSGFLTGVADIAAGDLHALAIKTNGDLYSWGSGGNGRLGIGSTTTQQAPVRVKDPVPGTGFLVNVVAADGGVAFSLAVTSNTNAWAWGVNSAKQLGDGTTTQRTRPVAVAGTDYIAAAKAPTFNPLGGTSNTPQTVSITTTTPGAAVRYTVGVGSTPADPVETDAELLPSQTLPINVSSIVKARAFASPLLPSAVSQQTYTLQVLPPTVLPAGGTYSGSVTVSMSPVTSGSTIYYTLDGSDPTTGSTPYSGAFNLTSSATVKAKAFKQDWTDSDTTAVGYTVVAGALDPPTVTPSSATYISAASVSMSSIPGATIRYTMDGADPDASATVYTSALDVDISMTIKAKAWHPDYQPSAVTTRTYTIQADIPTVTPDGGTFATSQVVTASSPTSGATVRYTTNGLDPASSDPDMPAGGLYLSSSVTLKTRSFKTGATPSTVKTSSFVINNPRVIGGANHAAFVKPDGSEVWTWGQNNGSGTLANGTGSESSQPAAASPGVLTGVNAVAFGRDHSLFLMSDGTVKASGVNFYGQLGNGESSGGAPNRLTPITVMANASNPLSNIVAIAAGEYFSLALSSAGTVWAWGMNTNGQLGDGSGQLQAFPVQAKTGCKGIGAGTTWGMAIDTAGRVWTWGSNYYGQLGDGTKTDSLIPVLVNSLSGIVGLAGGGRHTLALRNDGTVWTWGDNTIRQAGDGTTVSHTTPVLVPGLTNVVAIAASHALHSLALRSDGTVWSWGDNAYAALGDGTTNTRLKAQVVPGLTNVAAIGVGSRLSFAVTTDQAVWAWGQNWNGFFGQLGDGSARTKRESPTLIMDPAFTPKAATPTMNSESGQWGPTGSPASVTVSGVQGTEIHYTLNDTDDPQISDPLAAYTGTAVSLSPGTSVLKARSWQAGRNPSNVAREDYRSKLNPVSFTPAGGTYGVGQSVALSSAGFAPGGTEFWYSTDGSDPIPGGPASVLYSTAINVGASMTLKAIAHNSAYTASDVSTATYVINITPSTVSTPVASPPPGTYTGTQSVTLSSDGLEIYYTINGTDPSPGAPGTSLFTGSPINVDRSLTLKARAYRPGWTPSNLLWADYTINGASGTVDCRTGSGTQPTTSHSSNTYFNEISVTLGCVASGSQILYTTDGSTPSYYSATTLVYSGPVWVDRTLTLQAKGVNLGWSDSSALTLNFTLALPPPSLNPGGGGYSSPQQVTISESIAGSTLRYTLDGKDPDLNGLPVPSGTQVSVDSTNVLKVKAWRDGWTPSQTSAGSYVIGSTIVDTLRFWPPAGTYDEAQEVAIWSTTPDVLVRYTTDGSDPDAFSAPVTGRILVAESGTLKALAFKVNQTPSAVGQAAYVIQSAAVATPTLDTPSGTLATARWVGVSTATPGAEIRYTTNGLDPTETDELADGAIPVESPQGVKLRAFKAGMTPSAVRRATYNISGALDLGDKTSMAVNEWGHLYAWGDGALGGGAFEQQSTAIEVPLDYQSLAIISVAASPTSSATHGHTLALDGGGTVWAFGRNNSGQLNGTPNSPSTLLTPTAVAGIEQIVAVAAGDQRSIAIRSDGTVWQWGSGAGISQVMTGSGALSDVIAIAAGGQHYVALKSDGTVWSWGQGAMGQLGNGGTTTSTTAVQATGLTGVMAIAASANSTFALKTDGASRGVVYAWGSTDQGILANGVSSTSIFQTTPIPIGGLGAVRAIDAANNVAAALRPHRLGGDRLLSWGSNADGGLGDGTRVNRLLPATASFTQNQQVAVGASHMLVHASDGSVWAWGRDAEGQLGIGYVLGQPTSQAVPVEIDSFTILNDPTWLEDDLDDDGLSNGHELDLGSDPFESDTNGDGIPDGMADASDVSVTEFDQDHDGVVNWEELEKGTDPFLADSDGDGVADGIDAFPLDPTRTTAPEGTPGDVTPPTITLTEPTNAQLISSTP